MMKYIKKIISIILIVAMLIDTIPRVQARTTVSFGEKVTNQGSSGGGGGHNGEQGVLLGDSVIVGTSTKNYSCSWEYTLTDNTTDIVSVYDMNNNDIIKDGFTIDAQNLPKAGTAVGLTIRERRLGKIAVRYVEVKEVTTSKKQVPVYECAYKQTQLIAIDPDTREPINKNIPEKFKCKTTIKETTSSRECPKENNCTNITDEPVRTDRYKETDEIITVIKTTHYDFINGTVTGDGAANKSYSTGPNGELKSITVNDSTELEKTIDCINMASIFLAYPNDKKKVPNFDKIEQWLKKNSTTPNAGNWQTYTKASYDLFITGSNDANKNEEKVSLTQERAQKTAAYYDPSGQKIECTDGQCKFVYYPGTQNDKTYTIGHFRVNTKTGFAYNNPNLKNRLSAYLVTYYSYETDKTCMNVKTGKVSYVPLVDADGVKKLECDSKTEVTIENEKFNISDEFETKTYGKDGDSISIKIDNIPETQWHYFIPLNIKSSNGIQLKYQDHYDGPRTTGICLNALEEYYIIANGTAGNKLKYTELLKPKSGVSNFIGDYICLKNCGTDEAIFRENSEDVKRIEADGGCYSAGEKTFSTQQLFYNEYEVASFGEKLFKGFNFYYKPINIGKENQVDMVFPNGVKTKSNGELLTVTLWDDWYKDQESLDLSKSFETKTYVAYNINAKEIRKYNQDNLYTSWQNMNIDGTSKFINGISVTGDEETTGIIRYVNTDKIYKLGCGPANKDQYMRDENGNDLVDASGEKIKNPLYIKGCEMP